MGRNLILERRAIGGNSTLTHDRLTHDDRRTLGLGIGSYEGCTDLVDVVAIYGDHVPIPSLILHLDVLRINLVHLGRELDVVRVVVHDEVREAQVTGDAAYTLRDLLLNGTIRNVGVGLVSHPLAKASHHEALGNRSTEGDGMTLTQGTRRVLHTTHHVHLGVTGRHAAPLAQVLQILHRVVAGQSQRSIEHRRHVTRVEEETITVGVIHLLGIVVQELGKEDGHEIGTAHRATGVTRLGLFDHRSRQDTDVVGNALQFGISSHNIKSVLVCCYPTCLSCTRLARSKRSRA